MADDYKELPHALRVGVFWGLLGYRMNAFAYAANISMTIKYKEVAFSTRIFTPKASQEEIFTAFNDECSKHFINNKEE